MAAIASANVTYTILPPMRKFESNEKQLKFDVSFGNGTLTYPAGGISLLKASLGCPNNLTTLMVENASASDGFVYKYDSAAQKLRIYQQNSTIGPLVELSGAATPAATTLRVEARGW